MQLIFISVLGHQLDFMVQKVVNVVVIPIYESLWPHLLTKDSIDSGVELLGKKKLDPKKVWKIFKKK